MPLRQETITTTVDNEPAIRHVYDHHEPRVNDTLVVMLPGVAYLNSHPVLHFIHMMCWEHQLDVLAVNYRFQVDGKAFQAEEMPATFTESLQAIQQISANYGHIVIVAKSLGTMLAASLVNELLNLRLLMLTPIGTTIADVEGTPTLAIIGTDDHAYERDKVRNTPTTEWRTYEGLNHALQVKGDWKKSVAALPSLLSACEHFILG